MSTTRSPRSRSCDLGDDDPTVIDGAPLAEFDEGKTMPRCQECGRVVFFDSFTEAASLIAMNLFSADRCVRSKDGRLRWCGEAWELRYRPPR